MRTKKELKEIFQSALRNKYGFAPALSAIVLLEANGDGTCIMASVGAVQYQFRSAVCSDGRSVWVGKGAEVEIYEG